MRFQRLDDLGGGDLVVAPIDGKTALGEIEPRVDHARQLGQPALDLADAAGAADAVDRERHMRRAGVAPSTKDDRSSVSAMIGAHFKTMRFFERNSCSPWCVSSMTRSH